VARIRTFAVVISGAVVAGIFTAVWTAPDWIVDELARRYPGCLYRVPIQQRLLALTFDDGPDSETTPRILAELRRHGARATFFLIAGRVPGREHVVRGIVKEGHEVGNHFTQDRPSIQLKPSDFKTDLLQAHQALAAFAPLRWARPGSGWYSREMIGVMKQNGYRCALASVYPFDATIPWVHWTADYVLRNARPGGIVALHDGGARGLRTARVLASAIPELQRRGYRLVSLSELMAAAA
jgi:peptidoglycan/xylan/chitin deacetylase (PgdA/CDA1 family)